MEANFDIPEKIRFIEKDNLSQLADSEMNHPLSALDSKIGSSLGSGRSTPSITPYKMTRNERSKCGESRLGVAKSDISRLQSKIQQLESQIEQTKNKKNNTLEEEEKKVDVEGLSVIDDEELPKPPEQENDESAFDNILKSFNIGLEHSEITASVMTKRTPM